ncbi:MAG: beta strand repeat-containing protein, partial [Mycobacteriales bacterium]
MGALTAILVATLGVVGARAGNAVTFTVTSTVDAPDANPGGGVCASTAAGNPCTLRAAIQEADALGSGSTVTIDVPAGSYDLTIPPSGSDGVASGDLNITTGLTIIGAGSGLTTVDGGQLDRVFSLTSGTSVNLVGLTIQDGLVNTSSGNAYGGAIYASGALTLTSDVITGSSASTTESTGQASGGGIYADATSSLTLVGTTVSGNSTNSSATTASSTPNSEGGGIAFFGTSLVLRDTTVSANTAASQQAFTAGGGIYDEGSLLTVGGSTISHNSAQATNATSSSAYGDGGGLYYAPTASAPPPATITDSTIANNTVVASTTSGASPDANAMGGGMDLETSGDATLSNDVISGNSVTASASSASTASANGYAGGLEAYIYANSTLTADDVTVADNTVTAPYAQGGGMESDSTTAHISGSAFTGNQVIDPSTTSQDSGYGEGGALWDNSTTSTIDTTTFADNQVRAGGSANGGALYTYANTNISTSLFANNSVAGSSAPESTSAGAIEVYSTDFSLSDSTVTGNTATGGPSDGGGLELFPTTATFAFDTIDANSAAQAGGLDSYATTTTLHATIVANNAGGNCAGGPFTSDGDNIDSDGTCQLTCPCDLTNVDPGLGTLADNGGP